MVTQGLQLQTLGRWPLSALLHGPGLSLTLLPFRSWRSLEPFQTWGTLGARKPWVTFDDVVRTWGARGPWKT